MKTLLQQNKLKNKKQQEAFTLVELILYISISSAFLLLISFFTGVLLEGRIKNQTIMEVESQGLQAVELITKSIRNSEGIIAPVVGTSSSFLTLDVVNVADDPTIFDAPGVLRVKEGVNPFVSLTNSHVVMSALNFTNVSLPDTKGSIKGSFVLDSVNNSNRYEYNYSKTFYFSASLK